MWLVLLALLGVRAASTNDQNDVQIYCSVELSSVGAAYLDQTQIKRTNESVVLCPQISLDYKRRGAFQPGGEDLSYLNEHVERMLDSAAVNFTAATIRIAEGRGVSVHFKIPHIDAVVAFIFTLFELTLLNGDGSRVQNCSVPALTPFNSLQGTTVSFAKDIRYFEDTCPLMLNGALIHLLEFLDLADSSVKRNMLAFRQTTDSTLHTQVTTLKLYGYRLGFDSGLFSSAVFAQTSSILLSGVLNSFEASTLRQSMIFDLTLSISRLKAFLHNNPDWLDEANQRSSPYMLQVAINKANQSWFYEPDSPTHVGYLSWIESEGVNPFDDASFCIFYRIEQRQLNVQIYGSMIEWWSHQDCTCTLFWVISHYLASIDGYYTDTGLCMQREDELIEACRFDKMIERCSAETIEPLSYRTIYDTILDLEFFKYLADVWLTPVSSVLGIIANFLVIRTFGKIKRSPEYRRNKLTDKSRFMWKYTYFNSWFMLCHGLIFACIPLTTCIESNGIYCPRLVSSQAARAFYLFVVNFLGNACRLAANMSSTLFVLYRYALNTDSLARFRKLKPSALVAILFSLAVILSLVTLFENEKFSINSIGRDSYAYLMTYQHEKIHPERALSILYLLNIFMGTSLFTLASASIDLRLLFLLKSRQRPKEEAETRITKMVILNGLFSFLFRFPEMISATLALLSTLKPNFFPECYLQFSRSHSVCPMLFDMSRFMLTLSYLENLLLLCLFNLNFRKHLLA
nr:G protein-coupled receptor [Proales similis]